MINLDTPINEVEFVFFDLETTGFSNKDKIIEIGGLKVLNNKVISEFQTLINPEIPIPMVSTIVHNITDADVIDSETINIVFPNFLSYIKNAVLVAHNINFDIRFIRNVSSILNLGSIDNQLCDTLKLARDTFKKQKSYKLQDLSDHFGFKKNNAHRALDDCWTCKYIFDKCIEEKSFMGLLKLKELIF